MADRTHRDFSDEDIKLIADTFEAYEKDELKDIKGFCTVKTIKEISEQGFVLTPGRYVESEEKNDDSESFDEKMKKLTSELKKLLGESRDLEIEIKNNLKAIGYDITK